MADRWLEELAKLRKITICWGKTQYLMNILYLSSELRPIFPTKCTRAVKFSTYKGLRLFPNLLFYFTTPPPPRTAAAAEMEIQMLSFLFMNGRIPDIFWLIIAGIFRRLTLKNWKGKKFCCCYAKKKEKKGLLRQFSGRKVAKKPAKI